MLNSNLIKESMTFRFLDFFAERRCSARCSLGDAGVLYCIRCNSASCCGIV